MHFKEAYLLYTQDPEIQPTPEDLEYIEKFHLLTSFKFMPKLRMALVECRHPELLGRHLEKVKWTYHKTEIQILDPKLQQVKQ